MDEQIVKEVVKAVLDEIKPALDNPVLEAIEKVDCTLSALNLKYEVEQARQQELNKLVSKHDHILQGNGKVGLVTLVEQIQGDLRIGKWIGGVVGVAVLSTLVYAVMQLIVIH